MDVGGPDGGAAPGTAGVGSEFARVAEPLVERAVQALRGMAYEHRLHILLMLRAGAQTPAELTDVIAIEPTALAHHLRYLREAGLVLRRRRGRQVYYALRDTAAERLVGEVLRYALTAT